MSAYRIFVCEAQPVVVEGLTRILAQTADFEFVGSAATPPESIARIHELQPDIVMIDQASGIRSVFSFLSELKIASPSSRSVLWMVDLAEIECFRALQLGR